MKKVSITVVSELRNFDTPTLKRFFKFSTLHRSQNSKQINIVKYISKFLIYGAKILDKCVESQKKIFTLSLFAKSSLVKWHPLKKQNQKPCSTFLVQFFMIYNFAFGLVEISHLWRSLKCTLSLFECVIKTLHIKSGMF